MGYLLLLQLLQQANLERCITTGGLKQGQARLRNLSWRDQYDTEGNETEIMFDRKRLVLCKYKLSMTDRHWSGWGPVQIQIQIQVQMQIQIKIQKQIQIQIIQIW